MSGLLRELACASVGLISRDRPGRPLSPGARPCGVPGRVGEAEHRPLARRVRVGDAAGGSLLPRYSVTHPQRSRSTSTRTRQKHRPGTLPIESAAATPAKPSPHRRTRHPRPRPHPATTKPKTRPDPYDVADVARHLSPMSRDMTIVSEGRGLRGSLAIIVVVRRHSTPGFRRD